MMKIEEYIVDNVEQLNRAIEMKAKPEWIVYRSGMLYEIVSMVELKIENKEDIKNFLKDLNEKYSIELKNKESF